MFEALDSHAIQGIIFIFVCITASSFFSASETAITALGHLKVEHLLGLRKGKRNHHLQLWIDHPGRVLSTILIYNNAFNIAASAEATVLASRYFQSQAVGIATGIITILVLIFGEIIPKSFARSHFDKIGPFCLHAVYLLFLISAPIVYLLSELANFVINIFGIQTTNKPIMTEDELEFMITEGEKAGVIEDTKKDMLSGVFEFDETKAREIMTPRTDLVALPRSASLDEALTKVIETGHSRLPVYDDSVDNIVGVVFAKDLLRDLHVNGADTASDISRLMREPLFAPESNAIIEVFKELKRTKNHMAVVIDEYGGTAGIVTMEDILEEIVGEIQDEYDSEEADFVKINATTVDISGSVNISDFMEYFNLDEEFEHKVEGEVDTVAGWITKLLGDLPEVGQTVAFGDLTMEVTSISRHRIERIRVSVAEAAEQA